MPSKDVTGVFELALQNLRTYGWCKHAYHKKGKSCLRAAITDAVRYQHGSSVSVAMKAHKIVREIIQEQYPENWQGNIPVFNDNPETKFEDVELVLEKAMQK